MRRSVTFIVLAIAAGIIIFSYLIIFKVLLSPENIKSWIKTKIDTVIPESTVKIGKIDLDVFNSMSIEGLEIKKRKNPPFFLRVDEINLNYGLLNLARGEVDRVVLKGVYLEKNGKINIQSIEGNLFYHSGRLRSEEFTFHGVFGTGKGWMEARTKGSTKVFLDFSLLNLQEVSRSFYPGRIDADGTLQGNIWLKVKDNKLEFLQGEFNSITPGKVNVNENPDLLSPLPERSQDPMDMLAIAMESMKDYRYDQGRIKLKNEGEDAVILFFFQGNQGKKEFEVHLHTQAGGLK